MKPLILIIMDGWGIPKDKKRSGPYIANTKNIDNLWKKYPHTTLYAAGQYVGLPKDYQGTSEVGHLNIGAGKVVIQSLVRINNAIRDRSFFKNKEFLVAINNCKRHNSTLHLMGLLQDQGVHAHQNHLYELLKLAKKSGLQKSDRISLFIKTDEELKDMLNNCFSIIKQKVGAQTLKISELEPSKKHKFESKEKVRDKKFELFLEKV